jgi:hypothetical protein
VPRTDHHVAGRPKRELRHLRAAHQLQRDDAVDRHRRGPVHRRGIAELPRVLLTRARSAAATDSRYTSAGSHPEGTTVCAVPSEPPAGPCARLFGHSNLEAVPCLTCRRSCSPS